MSTLRNHRVLAWLSYIVSMVGAAWAVFIYFLSPKGTACAQRVTIKVEYGVFW
jgi:hypothetical protein